MTESYLNSMTIPELKDILREQGLKLGGKKSELVDRLLENGYKKPSSKSSPKSSSKSDDLKTAIQEADLTFSDMMKIVADLYKIEFEEMEEYSDKKPAGAKTKSKSGKAAGKPKAKKAKSKEVEVDLNEMPQTEDELTELTVVELKAYLKAMGLTTGGKKAELVDRIMESLEAGEEGEAEEEEGAEEGEAQEGEEGEAQEAEAQEGEEGEAQEGEEGEAEEGEAEEGEAEEGEAQEAEAEGEGEAAVNDDTTEEQ